MRKLLMLCLLLPMLALAACAEPPQPNEPVDTPEDTTPVDVPEPAPADEPFAFTLDNMPIIDGSTANIPMIEAVYAVLLGLPRAEAAELVNTSGTDYAYRNLIYGRADILLVYSPAPSTLVEAKAEGVELEMAPIGRDGLVFLVNKVNPVQSLSPQQLVDIYSGKTTNWSEVGGENVEITAFQRPYLSGSQTMMNALVMHEVEMADTAAEYIIGEMGGLIEAVAAFDTAKSSIGYNVYYFVSRMELNENVRMLAVNGVEPSVASIADGSYPFVSDFYAVIRADAAVGSPERILFDWIQSEDGINLIKNEGYAVAE